jgi:Na+/H+ antiporter NhaD/arsenite permease-like protein
MMAVGAITPEEAYRAINLDTLALLLGMMIVVAHLRGRFGAIRFLTDDYRQSAKHDRRSSVARIPYTEFAGALAPVAIAGLMFVIVMLAALWLSEFRQPAQLTAKLPSSRFHKPQLIKAGLVTLRVIAAFFAGVPVAMAAFFGGALLLVTRAIKAHKVYQEIDGSLLLMFAGLFVVVAAAEKILLTPEVIASVQAFHFANVYVLTATTAVLSNIISNVPAVLAPNHSCLDWPISIASGS